MLIPGRAARSAVPAAGGERRSDRMTYVDGFLLPVPKGKIEEYRAIAKKASEVWKDHGALDYRERVGGDVNPPLRRPYADAAGARPGHAVIFSYIVYNSREHRDEVNAKVMEDPRIANMPPESMPFDCSRMFYGGFKTIVEL